MTVPVAHEDFIELVAELQRAGCEFVVVGAHALAAHGSARVTGDLEVFVRPSPEKAKRVMQALVAFGAPVSAHGVSERDFATPGTVYQMGLPPRRIDILTQLSGVTFDEALVDRVVGHLRDVEVPCIGLEAMLKNKRAAGRLKDLADAAVLEELKARRDASL